MTSAEAQTEHVVWGQPELSSSSKTDSSGVSAKHDMHAQVLKIMNDVHIQDYSRSNSNSADGSAERKLIADQNGLGNCSPHGRSNSRDSQEPEFEMTSSEQRWAELHAAGQCRPCRFSTSKHGCHNGDSCSYCHLAHARPPRPWKSRREQCKTLAEKKLQESALNGPEELQKSAHELAERGTYMRRVVQGKLRDVTKGAPEGKFSL